MNHGDGHDHVAKDSKGCNARNQPDNEPQPAKELGGSGQKCEYGRDVQHSREESHRAGEAISTEPPEHFLSTVGEEDHSQHQSKNSRGGIVIGDKQLRNIEIPAVLVRCSESGKQEIG